MKIKQFIIIGFLSVTFCPVGFGQTDFESTVIKSGFTGPASLFSGDFDLDGDLDILAGSGEHGVFLLENSDPGSSWGTHVIDSYLGACLAVWMADMNGDGAPDILAGGWDSSEVVWYEQRPESGLWAKHVIKSNFLLPHEVRSVDIDGDGDNDIVVAGAENNQITLFYNTHGDGSEWMEQDVDQDFMGSRSVDAADFDQDGDMDLVGASLNGNEITIWTNQGGYPINWTEVTLSNQFAGSHRVQAVDMNQDGLIDILGTAYGSNEIRWWQNPGTIHMNWESYQVTGELTGAVIGAACDFDQDGDMDVVGSGQPGNLVVYFERVNDELNAWKETVLDDNLAGVWPLCIGDFNGDFNTDFVVGGNTANNIVLFENIQEGRLNRLVQTHDKSVSTGLFIPPDTNTELPMVLILPYCDDPYAFSRLRDMLIPVAENRNCIIMVPQVDQATGLGLKTEPTELISAWFEYGKERLPVNPDSLYIAGLGCMGSMALEYGQRNRDQILGVLPFNPLLTNDDVRNFSGYPDIPVYLSSGTNHTDRSKHENLINAASDLHGKAHLDDMTGVGNEVLVYDLVERVLLGLTYIDTVSGFSTHAYTPKSDVDVLVYPNPAVNYVVASFPESFNTTIRISDLTGREVYRREGIAGSTYRIELKTVVLERGIYLISIQQNEKITTSRLVVNSL